MIFDRLSAVRADVTWRDVNHPSWGQSEPGGTGYTGFSISPDTANRVSAVFACNSLIAETLACLPCVLYRRLDNGGKVRAKEHRLYKTMLQPNRSMTAVEYFGFTQGHVGLRGTVISEIQDYGGRIELVPHHPSNVTIEPLPNNRVRYRVRDPRTFHERTLLQDEVVTFRDLIMDGYSGVARAVLAREAIAVAAAGEAFVGGFFKYDATGRLVISHPGPGVPAKPERETFKAEIASQYGGYRNTRKPMILYGGMEATELGKHDDSGFIIDPRKFQVADIARFWRVPGFMIGLEEKSTSWGTGLEQQKQGFKDFTMLPVAERVEQALARDLLTDDEREEFFFEFLFENLLRGDLKNRTESLALQKEHGVINSNEWRIIENMNPREGGDRYQETPSGTAQTRGAGGGRLSPSADQGPADAGDGEAEATSIPAPLLLDAAIRIASAETREIEKHGARAREDGGRFIAWLRAYERNQAAYVHKVLAPIAASFGLGATVTSEAIRRIETSALVAIGPEGPAPAWLEGRAEEIGRILTDTFCRSRRAA